MANWQCRAAQGLPVDEDRAWDDQAARESVFTWAGWPAAPDPARARRAFLAYDAAHPLRTSSYALPCAAVVDGRLTAVRAGLAAAAARLPQTEGLPAHVRTAAAATLESYTPAEPAPEERTARLGYTPFAIEARAGGGEDLVALAKGRALDAAVFDEHDVFTFSGVATNSRWDSYSTRQGASSLKNYAEEAAAGVSYLLGHDQRQVIGATLTGAYTGAQGNGVATVRAGVMMINDPATAPLIAKIRAGILKDQSIGFFDGEYICSICGKDMERWYERDGCPHFLGMAYPQTDSTGQPKKDAEPIMARATIENAHLGELSTVFDGATPGAMIDKARAMAAADALDYRARAYVTVRYKLRLPGGARVYAVRTPRKQEEETMDPEERITELEAALEKHLGTIRQQTGAVEAIRAAVGEVPAELAGAELVKTVAWLAGERARLVPLADDGRAYRADLVEAALTEGTRALGADFSRETYAQILEAAPIAVIKRMRDDWATTAARTFPGGRMTSDTQEEPTPAPVRREPAVAYRG